MVHVTVSLCTTAAGSFGKVEARNLVNTTTTTTTWRACTCTYKHTVHAYMPRLHAHTYTYTVHAYMARLHVHLVEHGLVLGVGGSVDLKAHAALHVHLQRTRVAPLRVWWSVRCVVSALCSQCVV